jgi:hypothetical protein
MTIKTTTDKAAVVDTSIHWIDATEQPPPLNAKLLCINRRQNIATLSNWIPSFGFTHWAPLPTWKD